MPPPDQIATFGVLAAALWLFVSERIPADLTALLIPVALGVLGVLTPAEALQGFGNPAVLTVAGMFVLSGALVRSGAVAALGGVLRRLGSGGERRAVVALVAVVALPSMLINNTLVVVVFLPAVLGVAHHLGVAPSRLLIALSYGSILGGCCTLVGTSTTVLVDGLLPLFGADRLMFFEPLPVGLLLVLVGMLYLATVGRTLLPDRRTVTTVGPDRPSEYVTEVQLVPGSPLVGRSVRKAVTEPHPDVTVIEIVRGEEILWPHTVGLVLAEGDLVLLRGRAEAVMEMGAKAGTELLPELGGRGVRGRDVTLAELVVTRASPLVGRTVREAMLRAVHGAGVMAVERKGSHLRAGIADLVLRQGDTLLVQTETSRLPELRASDDFLLLEGLAESIALKRRAPLVLLITLAVILIATIQPFPIEIDISFLALGAAATIVLTRALQPREAYRSLDLPTLAIMGGTVALGVALQKSGGAQAVAKTIFELVASLGSPNAAPYLALAACWLLANVLTCLCSNTAAAAVALPIALDTARRLQVSERPFILAVVYAASLALATPMGYQTNLLVWGPGGYKFSDFVRVGLPLQVVLFVVGVLTLPMVAPLRP